MLSEPTPAGYRVETEHLAHSEFDETEYLANSEFDETPLDGCMTGTVGSLQLNATDICPADDSLFSKFLRSRSPSCASVIEFSGHGSDTAVDSVTDEASPTPTAKSPSSALDHDVVPAEGQSYPAVKPIRIRLRVNPPRKRLQETNIILRLKRP
jgi:hypothetical protein